MEKYNPIWILYCMKDYKIQHRSDMVWGTSDKNNKDEDTGANILWNIENIQI